jgi:hypothetical protein
MEISRFLNTSLTRRDYLSDEMSFLTYWVNSDALQRAARRFDSLKSWAHARALTLISVTNSKVQEIQDAKRECEEV